MNTRKDVGNQNDYEINSAIQRFRNYYNQNNMAVIWVAKEGSVVIDPPKPTAYSLW